MGLHYVSKCLLVDERDYSANFTEDFPDFSWFSEDVPYQVADDAGDYADENVDVEILGCVSERFNTSLFDNSDFQGSWGVSGQDWNTCLRRGVRTVTGLDEKIVNAIFSDHSKDVRSVALHEHLQQGIADGEFARARSVLEVLESLHAGRMPGFASEYDMTSGGVDAAHDLRKSIHPDGTRVLVEIGFVWP